MSKFKVDEQIIITDYTPSTLNGLTGTIREVGLDDTYYVEICHDSIHYLFLTDDEISVKTVNPTFNIGDKVIVSNPNSNFYGDIGKIEEIKFDLDESGYWYYVPFSDKDDCPFFFRVGELKIFNLSHFFSQTTTDILSE